MNFHVYEMTCLWNDMSIKCYVYEMTCLYNVMTIKRSVYEMSICEMFFYKILWSILSMIFSDYEMPYQMYIYDKVSIRKTFAQFLRKKAQIFAFVAVDFWKKHELVQSIANLICIAQFFWNKFSVRGWINV